MNGNGPIICFVQNDNISKSEFSYEVQNTDFMIEEKPHYNKEDHLQRIDWVNSSAACVCA